MSLSVDTVDMIANCCQIWRQPWYLDNMRKFYVMILLFRFFSPEVLAQAQSGSAPAMPPLPTQKVNQHLFACAYILSLNSLQTLDSVFETIAPEWRRSLHWRRSSVRQLRSESKRRRLPGDPPSLDNVTLQHITSPGSMQLSPKMASLSVCHHHTYLLSFPLQIFIGQIWSSISQMWYFLTC